MLTKIFWSGSSVTLSGLMLSRAVLAVLLWNREGGFFWLSGDDASRIEFAHAWSRKAFFNDPSNVWPPLGIWIHGLVLRVFEDPVAVSSTVNAIFSIATIPLVYGIARKLFPQKPYVPVIAAVISAYSPLIIWLGLSGLSEPIFHFFLLLGVFFWISAYRDDRPALNLAAAIGFLAASMCRLEAWIVVGLFCCVCVIVSARSEHRLVLLSSAALSSLFIPAWLWWHWRVFGDALAFVRVYKATSPTGGFDLYLRLLWSNSPVAVGLALPGIAAGVRSDQVVRRYVLLLGAFLLAFTFMSTVAQNLPARNLTSVFWLLVPFSAYFVTLVSERLRVPRIGTVVVAVTWVVIGTAQAFDYHLQANDRIVDLIVWSRHTMQTEPFRTGRSKILVELRHGGPAEQDVIWDSLFIHAVNPHVVLYDRRPDWTVQNTAQWTLQQADNPSILNGSAEKVAEQLRLRRVQFVIAYSRPARDVLAAIMRPIDPSEVHPTETAATVPRHAPATSAGASIAATPNPVPPGPAFGVTTITWTTGDGQNGNVYVSVDGGQPKLFASGPSGSLEAPWIGFGSTYQFQLYSADNTLLSTVKVERRTEGQEYEVYTWPSR